MALPQTFSTVEALLRLRRLRAFLARRRALVRNVLIVAGLLIAARLLRALVSPEWVRVVRIGLLASLAVYAAVLVPRLRNIATTVASVLLCLAAVEAYAVSQMPTTGGIWAQGLMSARPVLGWGPAHPGVFRHASIHRSGRVIFDVDYTIDEHLNRKVVSAPDGPAIAFFGDSFTFGFGLPDADTLPQAFADLTGRRIRVLNFGMIAYGPHQFLRALETGLYDELLHPSRLFVFETAAWSAQRSACKFRNRPPQSPEPRYRLVDGAPKFAGTCSPWWSGMARALFTGSEVRCAAVPFDQPGGCRPLRRYPGACRAAGP